MEKTVFSSIATHTSPKHESDFHVSFEHENEFGSESLTPNIAGNTRRRGTDQDNWKDSLDLDLWNPGAGVPEGAEETTDDFVAQHTFEAGKFALSGGSAPF